MIGITELIFLIVLIALVLYACSVDTKQWLMVDVAVTALCSACTIPFAMKSQQMQTIGVTVDPIHGYLCNVYLCYCLMTAIATVLLRQSTDPTTTTGLLLSRTVGIGLATFVITYGHFYASIFNSMHLYYGVLGNAAWAVVNGYHLYCGGSANKQGVASREDLFLKVDIAFALSYALPDLLIPDFVMGTLVWMKADTLHLHLLQVGAGVHIGTAVLSYFALRFRSVQHKKAVLMSRIAIMMLMWVLRTYSWIVLESTTSFFSYFMASAGCLPFFPAYAGIRV